MACAGSAARSTGIRRGPARYIQSMFARRISIARVDTAGQRHAVPIRQIDSFAMRNFTNDAIFDDTFPAGDGVLEAGHRVPLDQLQAAMENWFRRKGYLKAEERLEAIEAAAIDATSGAAAGNS